MRPFVDYTPDQLAFCEGDAEMLQEWGMEMGGGFPSSSTSTSPSSGV